MPRRSCAAAGLSLAVLLGAAACGDRVAPAPAPSASAPTAGVTAPSATASTASTAPERDLQPVYPVDAGAPDPLAVRYCEAIHVLPGQRAAACCGAAGGVADALAGQCVRILSYVLGHGAATLAPADVDACVAAMTEATAGCSWVVPTGGVLMPPACDGIIKGALAEKAACRSSLECATGLRCQGLSTIDLGVCAKPKEAGKSCALATDMLAAFMRQDHLDRDHPECEGYCGHARCEPSVAPGAACKGDGVCGRGRCEDGKCTAAALPAVGEACRGACAFGARCVQGKCAAPKAEGEACAANEECRGLCERGDGGAGRCEKSCPVIRLPVLHNVLPIKKR